MMQSRRPEHGSSGELDVFGATSYFAGLPAGGDHCRRPSSVTEELCFQANNKVELDTTRSVTRHGPPQHRRAGWHDDHASSERHATDKLLQLQVVVAANKRRPSSASSGKSKLAALLSFMVSPSPRASFRKENTRQEAPPSARMLRQAEAARGDGEEPEPASNIDGSATAASPPPPPSSSRESSAQLQGLFGALDDDDDDEFDLGVATGDRRLQGITVVRGGGGGGEERWVVRCCVPGGGGGSAWDDEERREKAVDAESSSEQSIKQDEQLVVVEAEQAEQNIKDVVVEVEVEQAGDVDDVDDDGSGNVDDPAHSHSDSWDSDSSSDLFDLDLEHR